MSIHEQFLLLYFALNIAGGFVALIVATLEKK